MNTFLSMGLAPWLLRTLLLSLATLVIEGRGAGLLRLRGGKRGRNSVVIGKRAHQKRKNGWVHFVGGETFGVEERAGPLCPADGSGKPGPRRDHGLRGKNGGLQSDDLNDPTFLNRLRVGIGDSRRSHGPRAQPSVWPQRAADKHRSPRKSLCTQVCEEMNRLHVQSVLELGCGQGHLLQRAAAKCANLTYYVGVDAVEEPLATTLTRLSPAAVHPLSASTVVSPRQLALQATLLLAELPFALLVHQRISSPSFCTGEELGVGAGVVKALATSFDAVVISCDVVEETREGQEDLFALAAGSGPTHLILVVKGSEATRDALEAWYQSLSRTCAEHGYVGATAPGVGEGRARAQDVGESLHTVSQERVLVFSRSSGSNVQEIRDVAQGNGKRRKDMWCDVLRISATQDSMSATTRGAKVAGTLTLWDYCKKLSRKDAARPWR